MLVLTRKVGEEIVIGNDIHVMVLSIQKEAVRIGVCAPKETVVDRQESHERRQKSVGDGPVLTPTLASLIDTGVLNGAGDKITEEIAATVIVTKGSQPVQSAQAIMDRETIGFEGFGSVEMNSAEQVPAITALNCQEPEVSVQSLTLNDVRP